MGELPNSMLIYLHGFNSSPHSFKAQYLHDYFAANGWGQQFIAPKLPYAPKAAIEMVKELIDEHGRDKVALAGSSLGGYYAAILAEYYSLKAVLINPALRPYELMDHYLGENHNPYTKETYRLTVEHLQQLRDMAVSEFTYPQNYLLMVQTGDEVLDFRQSAQAFSSSPGYIQYGGSHQFDGFEHQVSTILNFLYFHND